MLNLIIIKLLIMQFFKKTMDAAKNYEFFKGSNIFDKMNNSTFGVFHNNIKKMDIPMDDFRLPIITIIGNESSGKSSLISNILKCDIFPINKKRCTKCPIKIQLVNSQTEKYQITFKGVSINITNKEDILDNVIKIMSKIDDIIEDELHILFSNSNVITSTYYDLPGIIEYPDELRQKSKAIVNKYIIQANTLIICVIPASTPSS
jgi:GTPase Era involved in 16S rRNA processing